MAVSQGKMLGHYLRTRCPAKRAYKCVHCTEEDTTQWRKRTERKAVQDEVEEELAYWSEPTTRVPWLQDVLDGFEPQQPETLSYALGHRYLPGSFSP